MRNKFTGTGQQGYRPFRKIRVALSGMRYAILFDVSVTYKLVLSAIILAGCFYYRRWIELDLVFIVTGMMLISEMFNTTIETLCDFVEPGHNEKIGVVKDIAAAATGISILVWAVVILVEILQLVNAIG